MEIKEITIGIIAWIIGFLIMYYKNNQWKK